MAGFKRPIGHFFQVDGAFRIVTECCFCSTGAPANDKGTGGDSNYALHKRALRIHEREVALHLDIPSFRIDVSVIIRGEAPCRCARGITRFPGP